MAGKGGTLGNRHAAHDKPWQAAVKRALLADDGKKLRRIADALCDKAIAGDVQAIKEIGDRLDGRPAQAITGADGGSLIPSLVRVLIVDGTDGTKHPSPSRAKASTPA